MGDLQGHEYIRRDSFLPFFRPDLGEAELTAVTDVLRSGWLTYGAKVREFGDACGSYLGVPHAVPVASCSAGLLVALKAMGVGPGDEVVLPSLTFIATLGAVVHCGARPVLADIDPDNLGLAPEAFAAAITPRTKAVIPVHLAGHPCRIEEILAVARPRGIRVLEDAAHAFGAEVRGRRLGALSDATVFSFYATKCITSGDGGLITTTDPELARRVQVLSFHGMDGNAWQRYTDKGRWYYEIVEFGYKLHLGDPAAAMGLVQLGRADDFQARRTAIAAQLARELAGVPGLTLPKAADWCTHAWHLFIVRVDRERIDGGRDGLIADLTANRIGSSVHFIPLHHHPVFREAGREFAPLLGRTERYFDEAVSLPLFPSMTAPEIDDVVTVVRESLRRRCR